MHAQRQSGSHAGGLRRRMEDQLRTDNSSLDGGGFSTTGGLQLQPPGTLVSLLRRGLSWPRRASRAVCLLPRRLVGGMRDCLATAGRHIRSCSHDYAFLYELLSLGCPLLRMMHEVLGQMSQEPQQLVGHQLS